MLSHAARNAQALPAPERQPPPYRPEEAAQLLGVSKVTVIRHFAALGGVKLGSAIVIPRARVDEIAGTQPQEAPPLERIQALLPLLDWRECGRVIAAAARHLAEQQRPAL